MNPSLKIQVKQPQLLPVSDLPTPVNWFKFQLWLKGYDNTKLEEIVTVFRYGFRLGFVGLRFTQESPNLQSALSKKEIVNQKIQTELQAGRIAGPFKDKPFKNFKVSPLGIVPKQSPGQYRLIHHLSCPYDWLIDKRWHTS